MCGNATRNFEPLQGTLTSNGTHLEEVAEFNDLGLITDHTLSWNMHIDMIAIKGNKMLGLIKRTCRDLSGIITLKTIYCSLVRSQLECGSVVWSPYTKRNISKLEKVQHRATERIPEIRWLLRRSPKGAQSVTVLLEKIVSYLT